MGLSCFICGTEFDDPRPSRLLRHAQQVHQDLVVKFTCQEPGCWGRFELEILAVVAVKHFCSHYTARDLNQGAILEEGEGDGDDEFAGDQVAREEYLEAEEELNPTGNMLDEWLLDDAAEDDAGEPTEFMGPPRKLIKEEEDLFDFLSYCVKHSLTHAAHRDLFETKLLSGLFPNIPAPDTLKRRAWKYLSEIGLDVVDVSKGKYKEPVPFFSVKKCIRSWLLHPLLSKEIVDVSNARTLPYAHDLFTADAPVILAPQVFSTMADGTEWLAPFQKTAPLWYPTFIEATNRGESVLFLHVLLFGDGLPLWKLRQQSFEVVTSTLGEFDEGMRSSFNSPAIQLNTMASKEIVTNFFQGYDGILNLFREEFDDLIKGQRFWCHHLQCNALVFAVFHGFEGDLPARCKAGGFKGPSGNTHSDCSCCEGTKGRMAEQIIAGKLPALRDTLMLRKKIDEMTSTTIPLLKEAYSFQHGITRKSVLWDFPGACPNRQLLGELMHAEAEGELPKHFALIVPKLVQADPEFFPKLDIRTRGYFRNIGVNFPSISTIEKWKWHLNAADRLRFCLHSIFLLSPFVPENCAQDFALWKIHVIFVQFLTRHTVTLKEVQEYIATVPFAIQRGMIKLYGEDVLTPNSHVTFHFGHFVQWYSIMRLYWTFPQESLLHKMKNITKKTSNHKATSYSCLRLFVLDRQLSQIFKPMEHIPKRHDLLLGPKTTVPHLILPFTSLGFLLSPDTEVNCKCTLTKNYQRYTTGSICATSSGLRMIKDLIVFHQQAFAVVELLTFSTRNQDGLFKFRRSGNEFLERESFLYLCWGAWENGEFVLNVEDK